MASRTRPSNRTGGDRSTADLSAARWLAPSPPMTPKAGLVSFAQRQDGQLLTRNGARKGLWHHGQPLGEERQDPFQGGAGRVPRLVDEIEGQHRMRPSRDPIRVSPRGVDLDALEGVAQFAAERLEPLWRRALVGAEAEPEHAQPVAD